MKTKPLITAVRLGTADCIQNLGAALQHLEQFRNYMQSPGAQPQMAAEELADAENDIVATQCICANLAEQLHKAQTAIL
jgi:hypothetical protein